MYLGWFLFSAIAFVLAIVLGRHGKDKEIIEESDLEEYLSEYKKFLVGAIIALAIAIGLLIPPIMDSLSYHEIKVVEKEFKDWKIEKTMYESDIFQYRWEYECDKPSTWYIWILGLVELVFIFINIGRLTIERTTREWQITMKKKKEEERLEKLRLEKEAEEYAIKKISDAYDTPDKIIHTTNDNPPNWSKTVFFVFSKEVMCYDEKTIKFKELISCTYIDNSTVKTTSRGNSSIQMSTDTGSLLGRSLVGGLIGGEAGAIIGGATASQSGTATTTSTSYSETKHDYTVIVNTKNIKEPLLQIPCGQNEQAVHEIVATLNAAIAGNK